MAHSDYGDKIKLNPCNNSEWLLYPSLFRDSFRL